MNAPRESLRSYRRIGRWLPFESLRARLFAVATIATVLPTLAMIALLAAHPESVSTPLATLLVVLIALLGIPALLWSLHQMLAPMRMALGALDTYNRERRPLPLPTDLRDDMGDLLRGVRSTLESLEERRSMLQQLATDDALTGLPSRRHCEEYLRLAEAATQAAGARLTISMLRVEVAGGANPAEGDALLRNAAQFFKLWLRSKGNWVGRWEGPQFLATAFASQADTVEFFANLSREFVRQCPGATKLSAASAEWQFNETIEQCRQRAADALAQGRTSADDASQAERSASGRVIALSAARSA